MSDQSITNKTDEANVYFISGLNRVAADSDGSERFAALEIAPNEFAFMARSSTGVNVVIVSDIKVPVSSTEDIKKQEMIDHAAESYDTFDLAFLVQDLNNKTVPIFINEFGDDIQAETTTAVVNGYYRIDSMDEFDEILSDVTDRDTFGDMMLNIGVVFG